MDERFAHITHSNGLQFQVLKYDDNGEPIDWDEESTSLEYQEYIRTGFFKKMWDKITT